MRDIVLPRKGRRTELAKSRRSEKDSIAARDRRILEFPLSTSPKTVAKILGLTVSEEAMRSFLVRCGVIQLGLIAASLVLPHTGPILSPIKQWIQNSH